MIAACHAVSSQEGLDSFTSTRNDMLLRRKGSDEHSAIERLAGNEIGKLRRRTVRIVDLKKAAP